MTAIIIPKRWEGQPKGPVEIDFNNPLSRGLIGFITPSGTVIRDAIGGGFASVGAATPIIKPTRLGLTASVDNTSAVEYWSTDLLARNAAINEVSVFSILRQTGGSTYLRDLWRLRLDANNYLRLIGDTDGVWTGGYVRTGIGERQSTIANPGFDFVGATVTWNGTQLSTYIGNQSSSSTAAAAGAWPSGTPSFVVGDIAYSNQIADVLLAAIYNRGISQVEHNEFTQNPWQILKPRREVLYLTTGSVTIPTLSSPGVTNILTTSATPQVTLTF